MNQTYTEFMRQVMRDRQEQALQATPVKRPPPPSVLDQIRAILAGLSPAGVMRPWGLDEIRSRVTGRYGRPPQRGEVAAAFKLLGWRQVRLYAKGFEGRHYWLPPEYELPANQL